MLTLSLDLNDEDAPSDSGFDDSGPFADTPPPGGVSLDSALREFGPAAIEDLIPRLRALAATLDEAHADGFVHGRLHPSKVIVTDDATFLIGRPVRPTTTLTPERDQSALAAIAYQWMFGRPAAASADRPVAVRGVPGVDRGALSQAFTRAMSMDTANRFVSCSALIDAIAAAAIPSLPFAGVDPDEDPVEPFMPESPPPEPFVPESVDVPVSAAAPAFDLIDPVIAAPAYVPPSEPAVVGETAARQPLRDESVPSAFTSIAAPPRTTTNRFSGVALILATIVGMVLGFAAGYMARPRALQQPPMASAQPEADEPKGIEPGTTTVPAPTPASPSARAESSELRGGKPKGPEAPQAPEKIGRLLVRSTPSGASVDVDGVARGVTPLAVRDLDLGAREITVSRRGYVPEHTRVVLTKARPSRSVELRLDAQAASAPVAPERSPAGARAGGPPRPSTPATLGKPAITTGSLAVESLPAGAAVTVNGKPSGTTPLTINDLSPGEYRVTLSLPGYRQFATTVRVVVGERARAAARLTEQEQE